MEYYRQPPSDTLHALDSTPDGLTPAQAAARLARDGRNVLTEPPKPSLVKRFFQQLADPMILVLLAAALISAITSAYAHESFADVIIILLVVIINAVLGVYQERKAEQAIAALKELSAAHSRVLRGRKLVTVPSEELVVGVTILMKAVGVGKAYIGIENNKPDAIAHLTKIAAGYKGIEVVPLKVMYPQGGEKQLIAAVMGRQVPPPPALPIDVGAVVCNASTTVAVYQAVLKNKPLIERVVTVTGKSVKEPKNLLTRMGTPISALIEAAGGLPGDAGKVINGGPMMGSLITSLETPVTKATGGLLVLPGNHPLIQRRRQDERTLLAIARTVCEQCRLCTDLCPRHLIGHELSPHLLVRAVNYRQAATPSLLLSALTCSECNVCESVACPVGISPMRINRLLKRELRAKNLRYDGPLRPADEMAKHRLVPVKRLISKLGLDPWYQEAPLTAVEPEVACVTLPLRQHIGISAVPCVAPGERVTRGQLLADIPADALGAPVHASIDGLVSAITEQAITLVRG